ncbi:MAG TPA: guanylate kinase [Thermoleophilaceae bacterium]|nr:guanylate kinase [Thermoleophilaceae bacterium]
MPHLAEQDDRRALRAPAQRARLVPAQITTPAHVLVITGPSGVGKGTLIRALLERFPDLELSVSATTRPPRPGEEDGSDYWFLSPGEFEKRLENGEFLEHATYAGNRYGTLRSELDRAKDGLVLEIELQGARQVRKALPEAIQVFIKPPSLDALRTRLIGRGAEDDAQIARRLEVAESELAAESEWKHVIVNDRLEDAVDQLADLVATLWSDPTRGDS